MDTSAMKALDRVATASRFNGVVRIDRDDDLLFTSAYGLADRAHGVANTAETQFAIASGGKGFTALAIGSLIAEGRLGLGTTARSVLGEDLPLIDSAVTVEHLLAHRSGIGDYLDEDSGLDATAFVLDVPVHELDTTEAFLPLLDGHPSRFAPGQRFAYCNSGYVVLALIAERVSGTPFHELVDRRVCKPAGLGDTAFLRSDELPGRAAIGYLELEGSRTNVFHLPVRGNGDGGIYSTAADIHALWTACFDGRVVPRALFAEMTRSRSDVPSASRRYGLGFWLHASSDVVILEGSDAGVSFMSTHDPATGVTQTVISNTTEGAWPIARLFAE